jgi:AbrB family looped-hinge helix DNA binding protein
VKVAPVTSKGRVTIPKELRQHLGIRRGSRIEFILVGNHVEMHVHNSSSNAGSSGFGMLTSQRAAVPADFDVAAVPKR